MSQADGVVEVLERLRARVREIERDLEREQRHKRLLSQINDAPDLASLLSLLAQALRQVLDFHGALINLLDEPRDNLVCEHIELPEHLQGVASAYLGFHFPLHQSDPNVDAFRGKSVQVHDAASIHAFSSASTSRFDRWGMSSVLIVPIRTSAHVLGTVMLFRTEGELTQAQAAAVETVLAPFIQPLCRAVSQRNLKEKEHALNTALDAQKRLLRFIAQINSLTATETIYEMISREFLRRFPFDLVAVLSKQGEELRLRKVSVSGERYAHIQQGLERFYHDVGYRLDPAEGSTPTVFLQNNPLYFNDAAPVIHLPMSPKDRGGMDCVGVPRTVFLLPIRHNSEPVGVLWLISLEAPADLSKDDQELVGLLCSFVGTAMCNAELYTMVGTQKQEIEQLNERLQEKVEELRLLASRDKLTGLANFGAFEAELNRRMMEYQRDTQQNRLSLVLLDVDHFKRFNDTYGHQAGNLCLQEVARRLIQAARTMDLPCRYGGEEFALILPKCDLEGARVVAERVRRLVSEAPIPIGNESVAVTISAGCACYERGEDRAQFIERADRALYQAKQHGRNRVEVLVG